MSLSLCCVRFKMILNEALLKKKSLIAKFAVVSKEGWMDVVTWSPWDPFVLKYPDCI